MASSSADETKVENSLRFIGTSTAITLTIGILAGELYQVLLGFLTSLRRGSPKSLSMSVMAIYRQSSEKASNGGEAALARLTSRPYF
jgi:hypothetical protein